MADHALATAEEPVAKSPTSAALPDTLASRLAGHAAPADVVLWAEFDLDESRHYAQQYAALTHDAVLIAWRDRVESIPLASIEEATIDEAIGADRVVIVVEGQPPRILRYTRTCRRDMTRLHRSLARRIKRDGDGVEEMPWIEAVERRARAQQVCAKCGHTIPEYAEGVCPRCLAKRKILLRLLESAKPYRARTYGALAAMLVGSLSNAVTPLLQRNLVDKGIGFGKRADGTEYHGTPGALAYYAAIMLATVLFVEFVGAIRLRLLTNVGTNVARDLRHRVYAHMNTLSLRFFTKRRTGSLITRVTNDTDRLWDFIVFGSVDSMNHAITIAALMGILTYMNWRLMLLAFIPLPIVVTISVLRTRRMNKLHSRLWTYWARMGAVVGDAIPGVRVVKAFANEEREIARFDRRSNEYTDKEQEVNRVWTQLQPVVSLTMRLGSLFVWFAGGYFVIRHTNHEPWTVGTLMAFGAALWQFYGPIMALANSGRMVSRAATSAQRVFEVLDTPPEIYTQKDAFVPGPDWKPRVEFRNVSFSYEGAQPALRDVSMVVEPGQMVGLCGHSGAGKSTFVNLLCRFYDVTDGQLLIDGVDVREYDLGWLRRQIGIVLQEPYLFHGTVTDNIKYGNPDATPQQVIAAARAANAHDFIVGLPDGYDTIVGERGQSLSGGERQRVSIARAILHDPKILILDEATSSVDTRTERQIQQALDRLVEGRTTFAIAHRLTTLQNADQLVVLDKGRIVETGTHAELIDKPDGRYAKLHKLQAEMSRHVAIR